MVVPTATDTDDQCECKFSDLLDRLNEINDEGKIVVLLIDELNKMGVPLDAEISSFLTKHFLDKQGRYLIFSSHLQFNVDDASGAVGAANMLTSTSGRTLKTLPLPFCTDRSVLEAMLGGNSVTDLKITLSVGIPSLLFIMCRPSWKEMSFQERFCDVVEHSLGTKRNSQGERNFLSQHRERLLYDFLTTVIHGSRNGGFFEVFTTPVSATIATPIDLLRFPLPYIPIILQFLCEDDATGLYDSLRASAESVEMGRDWEMVVAFSIYIRSLEAKYCKWTARGEPLRGPFGIATDGVDNVRVISIPHDITTVVAAVEFIKKATQEAKTIYIFQLAYARFPDYDGFVSYRALQRPVGQEDPGPSTIHGYQCNNWRRPLTECNNGNKH
jgi:hypothetical protein